MGSDRRTSRRAISSSAILVIVAVVAICAGWIVAAAGSGWMANALRSRPALIAGAVAVGSLVVLYFLGGIMWRLGQGRRRPDGQSGTAAVEFVLILPVAVTVALTMLQAMLVIAGILVVNHAGYTAARAAVVWVPEKISIEDDEPRNFVADPGYSAKLRNIKMAAVLKLLPVCASDSYEAGYGGGGGSDMVSESLSRFFGLYGADEPAWVRQKLPGKLDYGWEYTEVALREPLNGPLYAANEELQVWLSHKLYLSIPYVARAMEALGAAEQLDYGDERYAMPIEVSYTLTNEGLEDDIDVEIYPMSWEEWQKRRGYPDAWILDE